MNYQVALVESAIPPIGTASFCDANLTRSPGHRNLYAFGDSFSVGVGASCGWVKDEFDEKGECLRCAGAYPYQIIDVANASDCMEVYHVGYTGASMSDVIETGWNNRTSQLELMKNASGEGAWGTLSIGGNDVRFSAIIANCIILDLLSCDADMQITEDLITDPNLLSQLTATYSKVLETATYPAFTLIVPGYVQFFNAETEHCEKKNTYSMGGRYLTEGFRDRINKMVLDLNTVIQTAVSNVSRPP